MAVSSNASMLIRRLKERSKRLAPDSPEIAKRFHIIGSALSALMIQNAERQRLRRTGNLIRSLRYDITRRGDTSILLVGSFGVPYAAVHEFGFQGNVNIRSHLVRAHARRGRQIKAHQRSAHSRFMRIRERPYVRPAWDKYKVRAYEILRGIFNEGST